MADLTGLWDWLPTALSSVDSAFAIIAGLLVVAGVVIRLGIKGWRRTSFHRRRAQSEILDLLAIGRPLDVVESALGKPYLLSRQYGRDNQLVEERIYRLPGAWVTVQAADGAVEVYSITITDAEMYYDTGPATFDIVSVRLGRDTFADAPTSDSESTQIYAHTATFVRFYDYGCNAAGGQYLWLAFNYAGAGVFSGGERYGTGSYGEGGGRYGTPPVLSDMTVNTLAVAADGNRDHMVERGLHGPHPDLLRRG